MSTLRELSRKEWTGLTRDDINAGSLQRIADACEKMASSYDQMREDRDWYKVQKEGAVARQRQLERRIAGLRGYIKRLKKGGGK